MPGCRLHALLHEADRTARAPASPARADGNSRKRRIAITPVPSVASRWKRFRYALYRTYYRFKYFPFAKERRERHERADRGFITLQIDALSFEDLQYAIENGYAPNVRRLLEREDWQIRSYSAGLPSATPAAQAAIFFGTKKDIPAFRFYEKREKRIIVGSKPDDVQHIRDRLPQSGILDGGAGYVNIYDGGADRAVFTLAAKKPQRFLQKMGGGRFGLLLLLHPVRLVRLIFAAAWEYVREEVLRLYSQIRGDYTYHWWYLPFLHIATNVVLRELQTIAVLLDIYVGVPSIYTTYNVYDEFAHHYGPRSRTAYSSVRAFDRRVGEIRRMLRRVPGRPYDLYILSDHGQTASVPYRVQFGETLGQTIVAAAEKGVLVMAGTGDYTSEREDVMDFLVQELEEVSAESMLPARKAGLGLGRWLRRQYSPFPLLAEVTHESPDAQLVVTYSSSLAHVYWTDPAEPLSYDDIRDDRDKRALYYFLVSHSGIGCVITRMLDGAHVESLLGRALVTAQGEVEVLAGEDPLGVFANTHQERLAVANLARMSNAGDIMLFGAYDPDKDRCICFDDQIGAHGALGGRQAWPFIMSPRGLIPDDYVIEDPLDLHAIFRRYTQEPGESEIPLYPNERRFTV